jgi:hypothetical protein
MEALRFSFDHEIDLSAQCGATGYFGVCGNNPFDERRVVFFVFFAVAVGRQLVMQSCVKIAVRTA